LGECCHVAGEFPPVLVGVAVVLALEIQVEGLAHLGLDHGLKMFMPGIIKPGAKKCLQPLRSQRGHLSIMAPNTSRHPARDQLTCRRAA